MMQKGASRLHQEQQLLACTLVPDHLEHCCCSWQHALLLQLQPNCCQDTHYLKGQRLGLAADFRFVGRTRKLRVACDLSGIAYALHSTQLQSSPAGAVAKLDCIGGRVHSLPR
jgi:hypothetical protein